MKLHFPVERTVFQRNLNNEGTIYISGSINHQIDSVQARFLEYQEEELFDAGEWENIENHSSQGYFMGAMIQKGGWFKLEIRSFLNGEIEEQVELNKVGIGEVFVIAGQSNAQGVPNYGAIGASDDRVNSVNFLNEDYSSFPNLEFAFSHLDSNSNIGPIGKSAWAWGQIGDSLARKFDVPILFFNAALTGTSSLNWFESSNGILTWDSIFQRYFPFGFPYQNLKTSLNFYASILGVRAILWHQGETDTYPGVPVEDQVFGYYKSLIEQTRLDFGHDVAWMFSKVSYIDKRSSDVVLKAQDRIINLPDFNIFEGPSTDSLMIPRYDGVHFGNTDEVKGLSILTNAWLEKLSPLFFETCQPIILNPFATLTIQCDSNLNAQLTAPINHQIYEWQDGSKDSLKTGQSGLFTATLTDSIGNYKFSNPIHLDAIKFESPKVLSDKVFLCEGESLWLNAEENWGDILWSTGDSLSQINIAVEGEYFYNANNSIGCNYSSKPLIIDEIQTPDSAKFLKISVNGNTFDAAMTFDFCEGESLELEILGDWSSYIWSDGLMDKKRSLSTPGDLSAHVTFEPGCASPESEILSFHQNPIPNTPAIYKSGVYELGIQSSLEEYDVVRWFANGILLNESASNIKIKQTADYTARLIKNYSNDEQCSSDLSNAFFAEYFNNTKSVAYPNPTNSFIYIETANGQSNTRIFLFNSEGRKILEVSKPTIWENKISIPVENLAPGNYILRVKSDQSDYRKKITVL